MVKQKGGILGWMMLMNAMKGGGMSKRRRKNLQKGGMGLSYISKWVKRKNKKIKKKIGVRQNKPGMTKQKGGGWFMYDHSGHRH